jgi:hypothetical protein
MEMDRTLKTWLSCQTNVICNYNPRTPEGRDLDNKKFFVTFFVAMQVDASTLAAEKNCNLILGLVGSPISWQ